MTGRSIYEQNRAQIDHIVSKKSQMWDAGFRSGILASSPTGYAERGYFYSLSAEYKAGFSEGYYYAQYKRSK